MQIGEAVDGVQRQLRTLPQRQEINSRPVHTAKTVAALALLARYTKTTSALYARKPTYMPL